MQTHLYSQDERNSMYGVIFTDVTSQLQVGAIQYHI
jgi:hypothetical protein